MRFHVNDWENCKFYKHKVMGYSTCYQNYEKYAEEIWGNARHRSTSQKDLQDVGFATNILLQESSQINILMTTVGTIFSLRSTKLFMFSCKD